MLDLLVLNHDRKTYGDGTPSEDDTMRVNFLRGTIVQYFTATGEVPSKYLTGRQVPPDFGVIRSDVTPAQVEPYMKAWRQDLDWQITPLDTAADQWEGQVYSTAVRSRDGRGGITRNQAENYLLAWNMTDMTFTQNRATGNFTVFDLAVSRQFWRGEDITDITFQELGYDETTGQHQIRLNYGSVAGAGGRRMGVSSVDGKIAAIVAQRAEIERHNASQNRIDYNVWRGIPAHTPSGREILPGDDMIGTLKQAVAGELDQHLGVRRWRVKPGVMDGLMLVGGFQEVTPQDLQGHMQDYCHA